jgi:hypothetical protein
MGARGVEQTARPQSLGNARAVLPGSNHERSTIRQDGISAKRRYRVKEKCVRLIEADEMLGCLHGDGVRTFRAQFWCARLNRCAAHWLWNLYPCRINLYLSGKAPPALISERRQHGETGVRDADAKADHVPTTPIRTTLLVPVVTGQRTEEIEPHRVDSYPLLFPTVVRRLAYWRRIFTWLPQPSMLHQRRLPFLLPS